MAQGNWQVKMYFSNSSGQTCSIFHLGHSVLSISPVFLRCTQQYSFYAGDKETTLDKSSALNLSASLPVSTEQAAAATTAVLFQARQKIQACGCCTGQTQRVQILQHMVARSSTFLAILVLVLAMIHNRSLLYGYGDHILTGSWNLKFFL